jgi:hypothetical protein
MMRSGVIHFFAIAVFLTLPVCAQSPSDNGVSKLDTSPVSTDSQPAIKLERKNWQLTRGSHEWSFQGGYAPMQPTFFSGRKEYDTDGRRFAFVSLKYGRVIGTAKGVTYEYLFEAAPYAVAINNEVWKDRPTEGYKGDTRRADTIGITIQPVGFRFVLLPAHRFKPFAQTAAGFIFTRRPIPVPQSTNYNFVGDFGGGMMFSITKQNILKAGYRYYHISNMNIGEINPGYNANMFYVDMSFFSK